MHSLNSACEQKYSLDRFASFQLPREKIVEAITESGLFQITWLIKPFFSFAVHIEISSVIK